MPARGVLERVAWTEAGSDVAFLVLDRNGNGIIDDGSELFGNATQRRDGSLAKNGFDALLDLDGGADVSDGRIDTNDPVFSQFRLWLDSNHNGYSENAELLTLGSARITAILTDYRESKRQDQHGNKYWLEGTALRATNGNAEVRRKVFDVVLKTLSQ